MALCLLTLEVQSLKSVELFEILLRVQKHSKVNVLGLILQLLGLVWLICGVAFKAPLSVYSLQQVVFGIS